VSHAPLSYVSLLRGDDDVAHALYVSDAQAAARWTAKSGKPSVFTHMGIPDRADLTWRRGSLFLARRAVERCSAVTVLSQVAADELRRSLGVEARVINPGVDLAAFAPQGRRAERPTLFFAADLTSPRKRVTLLVEAFRLLRAAEAEARLVVSRPGDPRAAARFAAANPDVELVDVDDRADLARAYAEAWVTVLPSVSEAFGLVLVESLACGTPVVATNDGGMREVVDREEVGRLFRADRPEDLAATLVEGLDLAREPATAAACRRRAEDFSMELCATRYVELYRDLLG
jgi:glycosyltransferase involved in cell wall biosynthesis